VFGKNLLVWQKLGSLFGSRFYICFAIYIYKQTQSPHSDTENIGKCRSGLHLCGGLVPVFCSADVRST